MPDDQAWVAQLRFEIERLSARLYNNLYLLFIGIIYLQFVSTMTILLVTSGLMEVPDWFWRGFLSFWLLMIVLIVAYYGMRRDAGTSLIDDYQKLLDGVFLGELDQASVAERYRAIKKDVANRYKMFRRRK